MDDRILFLEVKNWDKHQHYKDRNPPWIKLYHEILDPFKQDGRPNPIRTMKDSEWRLMVSLWLLRSRCKGLIPYNEEYIFHHTGIRPKALRSLIDSGMLSVCYQDDSGLHTLDTPENRVQSTETESEPPLISPPKPRKRGQCGSFLKPTAGEVQAYLDELGERRFSGQEFVDANDTRGWVVGKPDRRGNSTPMADWKGAVRTWRTFRDRDGEVNPQGKAAGAPTGIPQILTAENRYENEKAENEKRFAWDRDAREYGTPELVGKYPWVKQPKQGGGHGIAS